MVIVAVAVAVGLAVVPIPVVGIPIDTEVVDPVYPIPPLTILKEEIVPAIETLAVKAAATGVTLLSTIIEVKSNVPSAS